MMKVFPFALALLVVALGHATAKSACGNPTDPCMNDENWEFCRELEEQGCEKIAVMESCPLQFSCGDNAHPPRPAPGPHPKPRPGPHPKPKPYHKPDACVSLFVYKDKKCSGKPMHQLTFPTWTKPGSPCCKFILIAISEGLLRSLHSLRKDRLFFKHRPRRAHGQLLGPFAVLQYGDRQLA